jgi:hypothetical protein
MPTLVLYLREKRRFPAQTGGPCQPLPFRQLADDFTVSVLTDLSHQCAAVGCWHPVIGLDALLVVDPTLELGELRGIFEWLACWRLVPTRVEGLRIHCCAFLLSLYHA